MLQNLLKDAARMGIRVIIEPRSPNGNMAARKGITSVAVVCHSEEYGGGSIDTFEINEYNRHPEICLRHVLTKATQDVARKV